MKRLIWSVGFALLLPVAATHADEFQELPTATPVSPAESTRTAPRPAAPAIGKPAVTVTRIDSGVPSYVERGVVMVPLRPLAQFLGLEIRNLLGVIALERPAQDKAVPATRLMLRNGSVRAQIGTSRVLALPLAVQTRLGNTFVPARAVAAAFGAISQAVPEEKGILIMAQGRAGLFGSNAQAGYRGEDAARVVVENNVGRALSLHLSGAQNVAIELGPRERITRALRPGVYQFRAASIGMKTSRGVRRFSARQRAIWNWGRK